ncbi:MAG: tRNA (adenosine(37)-N6)-threonylcarbamoyltransferase complex dimerization subunit type 1 TsaB [Acidobacteriota bacterium]
MERPLLVLDSASPVVGVALARQGQLLASDHEGLRSSSRRLLPMIDGCLERGDTTLEGLAGIVVLAGPGSFTGLRVGMATVLGLHQATGIAVTTVPTLEALAFGSSDELITVVDVLRGDWAAQWFSTGELQGPAERLSRQRLIALAERHRARLRGFGASALDGEVPLPAGDDPEDLAEQAARHLSERELEWNPAGLISPLYFRPPATTPPGPPKRLLQFRKE